MDDLQAAGLSLYPNPVEDNFYIEGRHRGLRLYNLQGQLIQSWSAQDQAERRSYPTRELPEGLYLLQFQTLDDRLVTVRLLKQ